MNFQSNEFVDDEEKVLQYFNKMQYVYITINRIAADNDLSVPSTKQICSDLFRKGKIETCTGLYDIKSGGERVKLDMFDIYRIKAIDSCPEYDYYY